MRTIAKLVCYCGIALLSVTAWPQDAPSSAQERLAKAKQMTLSACETALGKDYFRETPGGDEFVGMTRAFLSAGGQNVLASLWAVNDESTRALMLSGSTGIC